MSSGRHHLGLTQGDILAGPEELHEHPERASEPVSKRILDCVCCEEPLHVIIRPQELDRQTPCVTKIVKEGHASAAVLIREREHHTEDSLLHEHVLRSSRATTLEPVWRRVSGRSWRSLRTPGKVRPMNAQL